MSDPVPALTRTEKSTTVRPSLALSAVRTGLRLAHRIPGGVGRSWAARLFTSPRRHPRPPWL